MESRTIITRGLAGVLALGLWVGSALLPVAWAATEVVPLERLHVHDVIFLPTVSSQYEMTFTKPKTWQVSSGNIHVEFQHSHELLPHRSWLQVIVNDKVVKHIPLTKENATGTSLDIPMPVGLLKDFNTLNFRVEQHYADICEDPLDKSLWTQVLPATRLTFNYTPVAPQADLNLYPYPVVDLLTYSPAKVHYVTGNSPNTQTVEAVALLNAHLGQAAQDKVLQSRITFNSTQGPDDEHVVLVGTPASLNALGSVPMGGGDILLQGGQWVSRQTGQALPPDQGVLLFQVAPGSVQHTVLVVSGNSDAAVLKAAKYLTMQPKAAQLNGPAVAVPEGWNPPGNRTSKVPRYIDTQTRTFRQLGFPIQEVHKINAPPITYHVPVVSDFRKSNGKLWLDIVYSYSPDLNPEYSSLELRMNDRSIANIPLTNPQGEQLKRVSIPISNELIKLRNDLVAQFHLMPDKYGWCVDNYVDNAWGKILDDSQFRVEGGVASRLPDVGVLNGTMYPYSQEDSLQKLHVVVPSQASPALLDAMLAFVGRVGRATQADTDLRLTVGQDAGGGGDRHVAVFRMTGESLNLPGGAKLTWEASGNALTKLLKLSESGEGAWAELGYGPAIEQYMAGSRAISVFTAPNDPSFQVIDRLFETDSIFEELASGLVQQLSILNPEANGVREAAYHLEKKRGGDWWSDLLHWARNLPWTYIAIGLVCALLFVVVLPALFRRRSQ